MIEATTDEEVFSDTFPLCPSCGVRELMPVSPSVYGIGLLTACLTPDGPGRKIAEAVKHRQATSADLCAYCAAEFFQPAWLPLTPIVERPKQ